MAELYVDIYFGEALFLPRWMVALLCCVGGGTNRRYDTYRNSRARGPTLCSPPPHRIQEMEHLLVQPVHVSRFSCKLVVKVNLNLFFFFWQTMFCLFSLPTQTFCQWCVIRVGGLVNIILFSVARFWLPGRSSDCGQAIIRTTWTLDCNLLGLWSGMEAEEPLNGWFQAVLLQATIGSRPQIKSCCCCSLQNLPEP